MQINNRILTTTVAALITMQYASEFHFGEESVNLQIGKPTEFCLWTLRLYDDVFPLKKEEEYQISFGSLTLEWSNELRV